MKITRRSKDISILEMDFSSIKPDIELWKNRREQQMKLFNIYTKMIDDLESFLLVSEGLDVLKIKLQLIKLKREREKYRVSGIFELKLELKEKPVNQVKKKVFKFRKEE